MRSSVRDAATGLSVAASRARLESADDSKLMQEVHVSVFHGEAHEGVEHWQPYGRRVVPRPPDPNSPKAAEALVHYLGGSRSHPIVGGIADRRGAPTGGKPGDIIDWHYKGNTAAWTDAGYAYNGGVNKLSASWTIGDLAVSWTKDSATIQFGGKGGPTVHVAKGGVYLGGKPDDGGAFLPVQLVGGVAKNVYGLQG